MKKLRIRIADTPERREHGLMNRKTIAKDEGMFFKFPHPHYLRFWMKNTYIPLDIAFIDDGGKILQIEKMFPLSTRAVSSEHICKYALEVPTGWFEENKVGVGNYIDGIALKKELRLAQVVKKPKEKREDKFKKKDDEAKDLPEEATPEVTPEVTPNIPPKDVTPEMEVEGDYPQSIYTVPFKEGEKPEIDYVRDVRGKIKVAEEHGLPMEIIYWTLRGHMLPPRRVQPLEGEGYPIKTGPSGEMLVAFDISPTIQGDGWSIKGMQPKSFILNNIVEIQVMDKNGKQLDEAALGQIKNTGNFVQTPQEMPEIKQEKKPEGKEEKVKESIWERLKRLF